MVIRFVNGFDRYHPRVVPKWLDVSTLGSKFEIQLDANSMPSPARWRYRIRAFTGQPERMWLYSDKRPEEK